MVLRRFYGMSPGLGWTKGRTKRNSDRWWCNNSRRVTQILSLSWGRRGRLPQISSFGCITELEAWRKDQRFPFFSVNPSSSLINRRLRLVINVICLSLLTPTFVDCTAYVQQLSLSGLRSLVEKITTSISTQMPFGLAVCCRTSHSANVGA